MSVDTYSFPIRFTQTNKIASNFKKKKKGSETASKLPWEEAVKSYPYFTSLLFSDVPWQKLKESIALASLWKETQTTLPASPMNYAGGPAAASSLPISIVVTKHQAKRQTPG